MRGKTHKLKISILDAIIIVDLFVSTSFVVLALDTVAVAATATNYNKFAKISNVNNIQELWKTSNKFPAAPRDIHLLSNETAKWEEESEQDAFDISQNTTLPQIQFNGERRSDLLNRSKRFIYFDGPPNPLLKLTLAIVVPVELINKYRSQIIFDNIQFQYIPVPRPRTYVTYFGLDQERSKQRYLREASEATELIDPSRLFIYDMIAGLFERLWKVPGLPCLLKTICSVSHSPFEENELYKGDYSGVFHALLNAIFIPPALALNDKYIKASNAGRLGANCTMLYSQCPHTFDWTHKVSILL